MAEEIELGFDGAGVVRPGHSDPKDLLEGKGQAVGDKEMTKREEREIYIRCELRF